GPAGTLPSCGNRTHSADSPAAARPPRPNRILCSAGRQISGVTPPSSPALLVGRRFLGQAIQLLFEIEQSLSSFRKERSVGGIGLCLQRNERTVQQLVRDR